MTIAACYLSAEGVVLGADSTATYSFHRAPHYFNHGQKIFEVGEASTLGLVTWGLGGLGELSYRTLIAELDDSLRADTARSVEDVAQRWIELFWGHYSKVFEIEIIRARCIDENVRALRAKGSARTVVEEEDLRELLEAGRAQDEQFVGFCIGGRCFPDRTPHAYEIQFSIRRGQPTPTPLNVNRWSFWGIPTPIQRVTYGIDPNLFGAILASGKWSGSPEDLLDLVANYSLVPPGTLPLRDAIDFIHASIYTTIKAMKFSDLEQFCGGPIEIAVISTDRKFRWVKHKQMDEAISLREG